MLDTWLMVQTVFWFNAVILIVYQWDPWGLLVCIAVFLLWLPLRSAKVEKMYMRLQLTQCCNTGQHYSNRKLILCQDVNCWLWKKLLNSLIQSLISGPEIRGTSEPPSIIMETQRENQNRSDTRCVLGSWGAALRFWEKGYRQRADSPWGWWHINRMDVRHAPGQYYLHYEMSGIEYFAPSLRWIQADILSTRLTSLLLSFNSSRDIEHVLLKRVQ